MAPTTPYSFQLYSSRNFPPLADQLGERAVLRLLEFADHSFHVPSRSGRTDADVKTEMIKAVGAWIDSVIESGFLLA